MSVRHQLAGFIALQRLLDRRGALRREHETPPEALRALRAGFDERRRALEVLHLELEALEGERTTLQGEVKALNEEREHFRRQKTQVTNMRQLTAVVSELDHVESQLKPREERLQEIGHTLDATQAQIEALGQEGPEERAAREHAEAAWGEGRKAGEIELHDVERELKRVQRDLGEAAMTQFKKLWSQRKPLAVVAMDGEACSACHADLRPSLVQLVRTMDGLQFCDSCRRLLFDPEQFTAGLWAPLAAVAAVDGGARGNPGPAGCGIVLQIDAGSREEHAVYLGETTNNVAEYAAVLAALRLALDLGVADLIVRSDSELLVRQLDGTYRVRAPHLQPLWLRARALMDRFARVAVVHVRREANAEADRLANRAMDTRQSTLPVPEGLPCR